MMSASTTSGSSTNITDECLIAAFEYADKVPTALKVLESADFKASQVSLVTPGHPEKLRELGVVEDQESASPPAEKTMGASTLVGGSIGAALGAMSMVGNFLVAGPLLGMAAGAATGGFLTAVKSWGVDENAASQYESIVAQGGALVIVTPENSVHLRQAKRLLKTCDPVSLETYPK